MEESSDLGKGLDKLLEDLLIVLLLRHSWGTGSWRRDASIGSWTFLYLTDVGGTLLSSRLSFSLIIPGTSQAPNLFGVLRERFLSCLGHIKRIKELHSEGASEIAWHHTSTWCFINNKKHASHCSLHTLPRNRAFLLPSLEEESPGEPQHPVVRLSAGVSHYHSSNVKRNDVWTVVVYSLSPLFSMWVSQGGTADLLWERSP